MKWLWTVFRIVEMIEYSNLDSVYAFAKDFGYFSPMDENLISSWYLSTPNLQRI